MKSIDEKWHSCLHCFYGAIRSEYSVPERCVECDWGLVYKPDGLVDGIRKTNWVSKLKPLVKTYLVDKLN